MALAKTYINGKGQIKELLAHFGIYTGNVPFVNDVKVKQLPKNSWYDEDGDDEYVPAELKLEAYEMSFEIGYKGAFKSAPSAIGAFVDYLTEIGEFSLYCDYNNVGNSSCRFVSLSKPTLAISDEDGDIYKWNLTLKVNNPKAAWKPTGMRDMDIILEPSKLSFTILGGTKLVAISIWRHDFATDTDMYVDPLQGQYTISGASPFTATRQDGAFTVTAARYTGTTARSADIKITYGTLTKVLAVEQTGRVIVG